MAATGPNCDPFCSRFAPKPNVCSSSASYCRVEPCVYRWAGATSCTTIALRITIDSGPKTILIGPTEIAKGGCRRPTAIFAAALIVFVQLVGASHYHNPAGARHAAQTQLSADSELCSVCLIAFHAPAASSPGLAQFSPEVEVRSALSSRLSEISEVAFEHHFGRAPPASP